MPTPATLCEPKRKRGNPHWGKAWVPFTPALPTEFELQVRQLHLTKRTYTSSRELYVWCNKNKNRVYVPEWLLKEWRMTVEISFSYPAA